MPDGAKEVSQNAIQPFDFLGAHLNGFAYPVSGRAAFKGFEFSLDELKVNGQGVERVSDFMGHPRCQ
ncbi:MAG: hypothetical protein BWY82_00585 [Verrucomicrobia bacterium ADurb.Bin474]|nr:MAG: hypothetical protein BWY82_00585 [Verrucomicrobia bacterium ADurb.Bin474]